MRTTRLVLPPPPTCPARYNQLYFAFLIFSYARTGLHYLLLDEIGQGVLAPSFKPITTRITIPYYLLRTKFSTMLSEISKAS